jgi:hypothetical protein
VGGEEGASLTQASQLVASLCSASLIFYNLYKYKSLLDLNLRSRVLAPRCGSSTQHEETLMGTHRPHPILMPGRVSIPVFQCQFGLPPL